MKLHEGFMLRRPPAPTVLANFQTRGRDVMSTSIRLKQSTAWVALLALASASASGNHDTDERAEKVNYEDLNVDTLAGASILYHRIERAARAVCGAERADQESLMDMSCYRMAIAAAVAKVNSPWLTAIHDTKTGSPKLAALRNPRSRDQ
jgi:UrcA family protein